jgi:betaine-aldehyde dehydrogenase
VTTAQADSIVKGMWIDGEEVPADSRGVFATSNPATEEVIACLPVAERTDVERAVSAAREAFEDGRWRNRTGRERGKLLLRMASLIRERSSALARLETTDNGKPISDTEGDMEFAADVLEYYAGAADKLFGKTIPVAADGVDLTFREPVGVVGAIVPWNGPFACAAYMVAPALAVGDSVVLKPSDQAPLSCIELGRLATEAGLPPGVLNVVTGLGDAGESLVKSEGVDLIAFTGSTATGRRIMREGSGTLKRLLLELGGKSPNIVFADADLDAMVDASVMAVFVNAGQDCGARSRALVQKPIYDAFIEKFVARTNALRVGDPLDPTTDIGPLISKAQRDRAQGFVVQAVAEGGRVRCGGGNSGEDGREWPAGYFMRPTVVDALDPDSAIVREEIFGPVMCVLPFDSDDEAVTLANATAYGLSGSLWTRDIGRALRIAKSIRAGQFSINSNSAVHLEAPFGGYKSSGFGRQLGMEVLDHYTQIKNVFVSYT